MVLSILSYFEYDDARLNALQITSWNNRCLTADGIAGARTAQHTHASLHTTISVLEGLRHYELHRRRKLRAVRAAALRGREFLLAHRLFRSHRTGEIM